MVNCVEIDKEKLDKVINLKLERNDKEIVFLFSGGLNKNKGIDILLEVFYHYNSTNTKLYICGTGPLQDLVEQYSKLDKRVIY